MNFETVLFTVAFLLLAILTQPRNEAILTDSVELEENNQTIAAVVASKDDDASAVMDPEANAAIADAQKE